MNRGWAIVLVAALFLSGVAVGALGMHLYYFEKHQDSMRHVGGGPRGPGGFGGPGGPRELAGRRMATALGLSEEQEQAVQRILDQSHQRAAEIRHELRPRVEQLMHETTAQIEELLTPEQRERFQKLLEREREFLLGPGGDRRGRRFRHRSGPPPPS